jgi:urease accessory protein
MNDSTVFPTAQTPDAALRQRARGEVRAAFARVGERTEAARVYETGGLRLRFPRAGAECEAVVVNTGGGMAGGDRASVELVVGPQARVVATTQSAEKIYRSEGDPVCVETRLRVESGGALAWIPQETLLFEAARFERRLDAHGEARIAARFRDRWRVRRDGRLVFAEETRLDDAGAALDRPAVGRGARAVAAILSVAPNAEAQLPRLRAALETIVAREGEPIDAGASAFDGLVVARLASPSPSRLRAALIEAMLALRGREAPRVWS